MALPWHVRRLRVSALRPQQLNVALEERRKLIPFHQRPYLEYCKALIQQSADGHVKLLLNRFAPVQVCRKGAAENENVTSAAGDVDNGRKDFALQLLAPKSRFINPLFHISV